MNRFLRFERNIIESIRFKLLYNQTLNNAEKFNVWNTSNYCGLNPIDDKHVILDQIFKNLRENENELNNIKNQKKVLEQKEKVISNRITFYQNLERYF